MLLRVGITRSQIGSAAIVAMGDLSIAGIWLLMISGFSHRQGSPKDCVHLFYQRKAQNFQERQISEQDHGVQTDLACCVFLAS